MEIEIGDEGRAVVHGDGDLDVVAAPELRMALLDAIRTGHTEIVIDLRDVTFIDAASIGVLLAADARARHMGGHVSLENASHRIARVLELAGVRLEVR